MSYVEQSRDVEHKGSGMQDGDVTQSYFLFENKTKWEDKNCRKLV
jgi:hypothetical protein